METFYTILIIIAISLTVTGIAWLLLMRMIKEQKIFLDNAKIGDRCHVHGAHSNININECEILEIGKDTVIVKSVHSKNAIYPPKEKHT